MINIIPPRAEKQHIDITAKAADIICGGFVTQHNAVCTYGERFSFCLRTAALESLYLLGSTFAQTVVFNDRYGNVVVVYDVAFTIKLKTNAELAALVERESLDINRCFRLTGNESDRLVLEVLVAAVGCRLSDSRNGNRGEILETAVSFNYNLPLGLCAR